MRCFKCKKVLWPWSVKSTISFCPVHLTCHQELIDEAMKSHPELKDSFKDEIASWNKDAGRKSGLII